MIIEYMTIDEARVYLGISQKKLNKLIKDGLLKTIPDTMKSGLTLIKKEDVDNLKIRLRQANKNRG